jgi:hypothetical protein
MSSSSSSSVTGHQLVYDQKNFIFPLSQQQFSHCVILVSQIYLRYDSFGPLLRDVYDFVPKNHIGYRSTADMKLKLRRVFHYWTHNVLRKEIGNHTNNSPTFTQTNQYYCSSSILFTLFFVHKNRSIKGTRRRALCGGMPDSVKAEIRGFPSNVDTVIVAWRKKWLDAWEKIKSHRNVFRDRNKACVPPPWIERMCNKVTSFVYCSIRSLGDLLIHIQGKLVDTDSCIWKTEMINKLMLIEEVKTFKQWLINQMLLTTATYRIDPELDRTTPQPTPTKEEATQRATKATRQFMMSSINLRTKQILLSDPMLSQSKSMQTFRAEIATLCSVKLEDGIKLDLKRKTINIEKDIDDLDVKKKKTKKTKKKKKPKKTTKKKK